MSAFPMIDLSRLYKHAMYTHAFLPYRFNKKGKAIRPARMLIDLTGRCNLKCRFCYQRQSYKDNVTDLDFDTVASLIEQAPRYSLVTFSGGEPFMRKDIGPLIDLATKKHFCNVITNGTLLTEDMTRLVVEKKLLMLNLSVDGIGGTHDNLRGVKGAFERVLSSLMRLDEIKKSKKSIYPLVDIKTVITDENMECLADIYNLCTEIGATYLTLSLLKSNDSQFNGSVLYSDLDNKAFYDIYPDHNYDIGTLSKRLRELEDMAATGRKTKLRYYPKAKSAETLMRYLQREDHGLLRYARPCMEPWSAMQINACGDVYPCLAYYIGNVKERPISEIWNSTRYIGFRKRLREIGLFPSCAGCCYLILKE